MILVIIAIALVASYLVLILNRRYLGVEYSYQKASVIGENGGKIKKQIFDKSFFFNIGKACLALLPEATVNKLERDVSFLNRDEKYLSISAGQALFFAITLLFAYAFTQILVILVLAIFLPIGIIAEIPLSVSTNKACIENSVTHVVGCLRVLVVKTETPLPNALEIIAKGLPQYLSPMKLELLRLLAKAEKTSMRESLMEWQTESPKFKDFLALLISINEGASKSALANFVDNFLNKAEEDTQEEIKNNAENLQLFLMGPIILMFLVILQPMVSAIQFMMSMGPGR